MAVYTSLADSDMRDLVADYYLGELISYQGISGGVENTNYFLTTTTGKYVLTLFEEFEYKEVPYFLDVVAHLKHKGFNVPAALIDCHGERLRIIKDRPAIIVDCFAGGLLDETTIKSCKMMGETLAKLHTAGLDFSEHRESHRGMQWWRETSKQLAPELEPEQAHLLLEQISEFDAFIEKHDDEIPKGTIHADLFYNNTLFEGEELSAIIDFYNACYSWLMYDLAIVVNDWCSDIETGELDMEKYHALVNAYIHERQPNAAEINAWPYMQKAAAMRFWLSRLEAWHGAKHDAERLAQQHDPKELQRILEARIRYTPNLVE
ncbi:homoserine kinase [Marinomonas mediterranea]|uniref:Homoserine kinase n=1 Tax=Marinomonas mediterranea (strain ATCC 700492 / JCM 21426 / NBRC 103028 / MMB-1) TaxID=717774 RepID=F2JWB4_MARM1|nr:homoserine kinase [Marinomonas mediterranea]ADZ89502.1 homoserine kinase [Marinomonas mediterranea MMB-1]WCN07600.1 homoserine kinase [Marinomonas mediterranea]WCN15749.1 homoserine kinase [Marinomonas mediterranea MMB-1]